MIRIATFAAVLFFSVEATAQEKPSAIIVRAFDEHIAGVGFWEIQGDLFAKYGRGAFKQAEKPERFFWRDRGVWFCEIRCGRIREFAQGTWSPWQLPPQGSYWTVAILRASSERSALTVAFEEPGMFDGSRALGAVEVRSLRR